MSQGENENVHSSLLEIRQIPKIPEDNYNKSKGFFGVELDHEAPIPICDALEFLRCHAMKAVGIFRAPGNQARVKDLMDMYNSNYKTAAKKTEPEFSVLNEHPEEVKPNDVSSLIKKFFNGLKDPIVPNDKRALMTEVVKSSMSNEQKTEELFKIIEQLPSMNKKLFGLMLNFLREILQNKEHTKMDASNLGMCMAVCFFRGSNSIEQIMVSQIGTLIISLLIQSDLPFPSPDASFVERNTVYDETFQPKPSKRERKGSTSVFSSFRSSMQSLMGGGNSKGMRSMLEDLENLEKEEQQKLKNQTKTQSGTQSFIEESTEAGTDQESLSKVTVKTSKTNKKKKAKAQKKQGSIARKRNNSFLFSSSDIAVEICRVVPTDTLEELRLANSNSKQLPPENQQSYPKKAKSKKVKKSKSKRRNRSAESTIESSVDVTELGSPVQSSQALLEKEKAVMVHKTL